MLWMKTEQGSKRPSTQMLERLYISEPGQQVQDGVRVFHLPEEWMYVRTEVVPCPTLIISLSRQCGNLFLLGFGALLKQAKPSIMISLLSGRWFSIQILPLPTKKRYFMVELTSKHDLGEPRKAIIITAALFVKRLNHAHIIRVFLISIIRSYYVQNFASLFLYRCHPFFFPNLDSCVLKLENLSGRRYYATNAMLSDMPIKINSSTEGA